MFSSKHTILIVDDDAAILQGLRKIFQRRGYCVTVADKGKDAVQKIHASRYDVALIDFSLPDMEGDQLFPFINETSPETVKIILSGRIELRESIEGADLFVEKPVAPDRLLCMIEKLLAKTKPKK